MIVTIGQQAVKADDLEMRKTRFCILRPIGHNQHTQMRQIIGDICQRIKMRRRGQQGLARCHIDHPGQRRPAEGSVDRHFNKVDLLQRIGHRQIGDAVLKHDGDMDGNRI